MARQLKNDEDIAAYLIMVIKEGDASELAYALGVVAKAHGMSEISQSTGLTREALYKALKPNSKPRFDTINRMLKTPAQTLPINPNQRKIEHHQFPYSPLKPFPASNFRDF